MTIPNKKFGIELEIKGLDTLAAENVLRLAGIDVRAENYNHSVRNYWKIVTDSSLCGVACEVVSPILCGPQGIEECKKVARALSEGGARIDKECGFHVHIDARNLNVNHIVNVAKRYAKFEEVIDTMMPPSRRGNGNRYCFSFANIWRNVEMFPWNDISAFANYLDRIAYYDNSARYNKINFMAYMRHKTIEFRQHSGTINENKIENWIKFCLHFVETSCNEYVLEAPTTIIKKRGKNKEKFDKVIISLKNNPRGLNIQEIVDLTGWCYSSVPSYISLIRKERNCKIKKNRYNDRYKLISGGVLSTDVDNPQTEEIRQAALRVNMEDDTVFKGMPNSIIAFYMERISDLSS